MGFYWHSSIFFSSIMSNHKIKNSALGQVENFHLYPMICSTGSYLPVVTELDNYYYDDDFFLTGITQSGVFWPC